MKYNKSEICKRANELTKNGMSKSAAFTKLKKENSEVYNAYLYDIYIISLFIQTA